MNVHFLTHLNRRLVAIIIALTMVATFPVVSFATQDEPQIQDMALPVDLSDMTEETAVEGELLVLAGEDTTRKELKEITEDAGASLDAVTTINDGDKLAKVSLDDPEDAQAVADEIAGEDEVLLVQPNYIYRLNEEEDILSEEQTAEGQALEESTTEEPVIPIVTDSAQIAGTDGAEKGDDLMVQQWYMGSQDSGSTRSFEAWDGLSDGGDQVTVAVIDTGVKLDHPDLMNSIIVDKCVTFNKGIQMRFSEGDGSDDDDGHGTHVCGIIASNAKDGSGISGAADNRARLMVIDAALPGDLEFTTEDVVMGVDYAIRNGAEVINMSIGGLYRDFIMENSVNEAFKKNVLCVCASGNSSSELVESPGDAAGAISVIAHDNKGKKASFSNYGYEKDVSAPGVSILSTYIVKNPKYGGQMVKTISGTSMASPLVAGMAALIKSENRDLNARELKNLIYTCSGSGVFSTNAGFGRVDATNAVDNVHGLTEPQTIVLNRTQKKMYTGESITLEYAVYPGKASAYADEVAFASSDPKVAKVDASGRITAVKSGSATITARCHGLTARCDITVENIGYASISKLPYSIRGYFSPDDPTVRINYKKESWEAMADGYETPQIPAEKSIRIIVYSRTAIPFVKVYDPSGREITNLSQKVSGETTVTADFVTTTRGKYRVLVTGGSYGSAVVNKSYDLTIKDPAEPDKVANTIRVRAKTAKVKYSRLKKKKQTLSRARVMTVTNAKGRVTYTKLSGNKKISINKTSGKVTIKKKLKKGKYYVLARVDAAGDARHEAAKRYVIFAVRVK